MYAEFDAEGGTEYCGLLLLQHLNHITFQCTLTWKYVQDAGESTHIPPQNPHTWKTSLNQVTWKYTGFFRERLCDLAMGGMQQALLPAEWMGLLAA